MSPETSRTIANLILAAAAGAAIYVVLRTPRLREAAWRAVQHGVTVTLPGYLMQEAKGAWAASGPRP